MQPIPAASVEVSQSAPGRCQIRGALTFETACHAYRAGERCLLDSGAENIEMDFSGVTAADSAGLAVVLDWLAIARRAGRALRFKDIPEQIHAVARISEIEDLLDSHHASG